MHNLSVLLEMREVIRIAKTMDVKKITPAVTIAELNEMQLITNTPFDIENLQRTE